MRQENKKRASRGRRKGRSRYMQQIAVLLVTVLLAGRIAPAMVAMAQLPSVEQESNVASPSGMTATDADWPEDEPESDESGDSAGVAAGEENEATPSQQPRRMSARAEDGIIPIEAEDYYKTKVSGTDIKYADIQKENLVIRIPLSTVNGFTDGTYFVDLRYSSEHSKYLKVTAGGQEREIHCIKTGWGNWSTAEHYGAIALSENDELVFEVLDTNNPYIWIDYVELKPADEKWLWFEAKKYVVPSDKTTGDNNNCANMDPDVKVELTLGNDVKKGIYELLLITTSDGGREYQIQLNDSDAGHYQTTGNGWGTDLLHEDG